MQRGPITEPELQKRVKELYPDVLKQASGDIGTCKKVINLGRALNERALNSMGLAVTLGNKASDEAIIRNEHQYLTYLKEHNFPVVSLHGPVFEVEAVSGSKRYGMLMDHIDGVFIEAKTPAPLSILLMAGLLGIKVPAKEAWLMMNKELLCADIKKRLATPSTFEALQTNAKILGGHFRALTEKLGKEQLAIADLQMLITPRGELIIIDPLDIVKVNLEKQTVDSLFHPGKVAGAEFIRFLWDTQRWLKTAERVCESIQKARAPKDLQHLIGTPQAPLHQYQTHRGRHAIPSRAARTVLALKPEGKKATKPKQIKSKAS